MNILIYSHSWWPKIGGVEEIGHMVANGLADLGHSVTVVTPTPDPGEARPGNRCQLIRQPTAAQCRVAVEKADIVHSNGIAMKLLPLALLLNKPFTWAHHGYQLQCIDGAGWCNGQPAPMDPWGSCRYHLRALGASSAIVGGAKLGLRRQASHLVSANIATSKHLSMRQPCPRQVVIYNPYDAEIFSCKSIDTARRRLQNSTATFTYLGRLVSEKGIDDLLHAFQKLEPFDDQQPTLRIIGDGPERTRLESLATQLNVSDRVVWLGNRVGEELRREIETAGICVMPSAWEEPGAIVVLQLMAAGKPLIVSQRGWLSEAAGDASLTFPNGDRAALAAAMSRLGRDKQLQYQLMEKALERITLYDPQESARQYSLLFERLVSERRKH